MISYSFALAPSLRRSTGPAAGQLYLRGKQADGGHVILRGRRADGSYLPLTARRTG